jgi:hypothetical protein
MPYLKFISDKDFTTAVTKVVKIIEASEHDAQSKFHKNVIDPFSALFHGLTHGISVKEWTEQEKMRQTQKTMQNAIGDFHQEILGSIRGWQNLGFGGGLDVINQKMKIIAEVKNKFNTTKGNHKVEIYDAIKSKLKMPEYLGYIGYYVEIIPRAKRQYIKHFTPPDNKTGKSRPKNEKILVIDGASFYKLATGRDCAIQELFEAIPQVIAANHKYKFSKTQINNYFELFKMAFSTE